MISMLQDGEGALVGSTAKALCSLVADLTIREPGTSRPASELLYGAALLAGFIHADSGGRAFRINAGPVHEALQQRRAWCGLFRWLQESVHGCQGLRGPS